MSVAEGLDIFKTDLGWFGIAFEDVTVLRLKFGFSTKKATSESLREEGWTAGQAKPEKVPWREPILAYASGKKTDFSGLVIRMDNLTDFQLRVTEACQAIPYGETRSYQQLAQAAGSPKAARAVGNVMKRNPVPIIVPCHRVLASSAIGGYSAASGASSKQRLLEMERIGASQLFG